MFDIYITGSNAFLLSSDLATLSTGRTFEIKVFPFSFGEYMQYFGYSDKYAAVDKHMIEGSMAGSYLNKDQEAKYDYIADVFIYRFLTTSAMTRPLSVRFRPCFKFRMHIPRWSLPVLDTMSLRNIKVFFK